MNLARAIKYAFVDQFQLCQTFQIGSPNWILKTTLKVHWQVSNVAFLLEYCGVPLTLRDQLVGP